MYGLSIYNRYPILIPQERLQCRGVYSIPRFVVVSMDGMQWDMGPMQEERRQHESTV